MVCECACTCLRMHRLAWGGGLLPSSLFSRDPPSPHIRDPIFVHDLPKPRASPLTGLGVTARGCGSRELEKACGSLHRPSFLPHFLEAQARAFSFSASRGGGLPGGETPRRCPSPTFPASFPRDPGCHEWGWGWKISDLSPCEGGDLPKRPASEFPGNVSIPQRLSLGQQRGNWFLPISLYLLQKCGNCTPGAM